MVLKFFPIRIIRSLKKTFPFLRFQINKTNPRIMGNLRRGAGKKRFKPPPTRMG